MNIDEEIMEISSFVQMIQEQGAIRGQLRSIFRLGRKKFGEPTPEQETHLSRIRDLNRLSAILDSVLTVSTWEEALNG